MSGWADIPPRTADTQLTDPGRIEKASKEDEKDAQTAYLTTTAITWDTAANNRHSAGSNTRNYKLPATRAHEDTCSNADFKCSANSDATSQSQETPRPDVLHIYWLPHRLPFNRNRRRHLQLIWMSLHHQTCRKWMSRKLTNNSHKRSWTNTNSGSSSNTTTQTTLNAASSRHRWSNVVQTQAISMSLCSSSNSPGCLTALLKDSHSNVQWELVEFHR